jgi:hypothetical protein
MRVAVLTLTRDRLAYTKHCFGRLHEFAGCDFDHYVLDQASDDGTDEWLEGYDCEPILLDENIGISRGMNMLLDAAGAEYDVYCTFDNDCQVVQPGTLAACAEFVADGNWIVSPTVRGLYHPPQPTFEATINGERVGIFGAIGGVFRVMPGDFARTFRFNETNPIWGGDENDVGREATARGISVGYLLDWHVDHYETTAGQQARYPDYFERKAREYA